MIVGKTGTIREVALGIRLRFKSGRDILRGISRYASRHCHWRMHVINVLDRNTVYEFKAAIARKVDGIILNGVVFPEITSLLKRSEIPFVAFGARVPELGRRTTSISFIRNNDYKIGESGADYLSSLGAFRSYIYIPTNQSSYASEQRLAGFTSRMAAKGIEVQLFPINPERLDGGYEEIQALTKWLKALPRPIAAMTAFDQRAATLLEAAQASGIAVPSQMAVLGVDNDDLVCEFTNPTLTSIEPDHTHNGELAAAELDKMMGGPARHIVHIRKSTKQHIVERQSTAAISPAAHLLQRGLAYIKKNVTSGITTENVVKHLGVSRRLADLRFNEFDGRSIHEVIVDTRLEELKRLLADSDIPIARITAACGFSSDNYAKNLFRRRFSMTMSDYRAMSASARDDA